MIPPTYLPDPRHGAAVAALVLAVAAVLDALAGIGPAGYGHHATDGGTGAVEVQVGTRPGAGTFHEQDVTGPAPRP
ncbi:hypothetical protein SAMN05421806_104137 [Streptomyces indicus]|uniref:Uncharacterized protein n=2 Tax=Streptomyces indicus TaxID=417292 RepID=A0A1G8YLH6_9ACTN|nr:hypothetical protein SAMN05421806_104137 [Streptomyces indicus]